MFIIYAAALLCTTSISTICCWTTGEGRPSPLQIDCSTASPKFQQAEGGTNEKGSKTVKQLSKKIKKVDPISKILSKGHKLIKPSDAQRKSPIPPKGEEGRKKPLETREANDLETVNEMASSWGSVHLQVNSRDPVV